MAFPFFPFHAGIPLMIILFSFLLRNRENLSPLQMAIHLHLIPIVDALCMLGADVNSSDEHGNTALLIALKSHQMDTAATLVCVKHFHLSEIETWCFIIIFQLLNKHMNNLEKFNFRKKIF